MSLEILAPPGARALSLEEAKAHMRVTHSAEDALIERLIDSAIAHIEAFAGLALIDQVLRETRTFWVPGEPAGDRTIVALTRSPAKAILKIALLDANGEEHLVAPELYALNSAARPSRIVFPSGAPAPFLRPDGIRIEYRAGFGQSADAIPADLRQAALEWAAGLYESRSGLETPPDSVTATLNRYRAVRL